MELNAALPVRLPVGSGVLDDGSAAQGASAIRFGGDTLLQPGPAFGEELLTTALKVGHVRGPVGRAPPLHLDMADDGDGRHLEQIMTAVGKDPSTLAPLRKVFRLDPVGTFRMMATFGPAPEHLVQPRIAVGKDLLADHGAIVVGPSAQERVELLQQRLRADRLIRIQERLHLPQEGLLTGLGGFDEELAVVFAEIKAEKIESVRHMRDVRFLAIQLHAGVLLQPVGRFPG